MVYWTKAKQFCNVYGVNVNNFMFEMLISILEGAKVIWLCI